MMHHKHKHHKQQHHAHFEATVPPSESIPSDGRPSELPEADEEIDRSTQAEPSATIKEQISTPLDLDPKSKPKPKPNPVLHKCRGPPKPTLCQRCKASLKCRQCRERCVKNVCRYFPLCWNLPLVTTLQFLSILDLLVGLLCISLYLYFHQFEPFTERLEGNQTKSSHDNLAVNGEGTNTADKEELRPHRDQNVHQVEEFHETTTVIGPPVYDTDGVRYSKLAYLNSRYQQEVIENCNDHDYYVKYLVGYQLNLTRGLYEKIIYATYISESFYMFVDLSFLVTTTAFISYTSAKVFLMCTWGMELFMVWCKIWTTIAFYSQRFCILEYGLNLRFRGVTGLTFGITVPTMIFRAYKSLVFSFYIHSFFTENGYLMGEEDSQGLSLKEFVEHQQEYLRMDRNREMSSSEEDELEEMM